MCRGSSTGLCWVGPAKVKASKSILFTEGSPEVEIKEDLVLRIPCVGVIQVVRVLLVLKLRYINLGYLRKHLIKARHRVMAWLPFQLYVWLGTSNAVTFSFLQCKVFKNRKVRKHNTLGVDSQLLQCVRESSYLFSKLVH